jgi:hypothetical protein
MSNSKKQLMQTPGANAPGNNQALSQQTPQPPSDGEDHEQITFPKRTNAGSSKRNVNDKRAMAIIHHDPPMDMEADVFMAAL